MSATLTNGTRKTLADQIDRLDGMLDGLAEAIPEAVADAVHAAVAVAVREAVQSAVAEVLTNPEVLARIREAGTPSPAPIVATEPPCPACPASRAPSRLGLWYAAARASCAAAGTVLSEQFTSARGWAGRKVELACRWRKPVLGGLGAGLAVALAAYLFGPLVGSLLCAASVSALVVVAAALASKSTNASAS